MENSTENSTGSCYQANLFLAGLPLGISLAALREMFENHRIAPTYFHVVRRAPSGKLRVTALAFVRLVNPGDTIRAIEALNGILVDGHTIVVRKYVARADREKARAVFHSEPHPTWNAHTTEATR
jgi:RNA recognition motif-containing protein